MITKDNYVEEILRIRDIATEQGNIDSWSSVTAEGKNQLERIGTLGPKLSSFIDEIQTKGKIEYIVITKRVYDILTRIADITKHTETIYIDADIFEGGYFKDIPIKILFDHNEDYILACGEDTCGILNVDQFYKVSHDTQMVYKASKLLPSDRRRLHNSVDIKEDIDSAEVISLDVRDYEGNQDEKIDSLHNDIKSHIDIKNTEIVVFSTGPVIACKEQMLRDIWHEGGNIFSLLTCERIGIFKNTCIEVYWSVYHGREDEWVLFIGKDGNKFIKITGLDVSWHEKPTPGYTIKIKE